MRHESGFDYVTLGRPPEPDADPVGAEFIKTITCCVVPAFNELSVNVDGLQPIQGVPASCPMSAGIGSTSPHDPQRMNVIDNGCIYK